MKNKNILLRLAVVLAVFMMGCQYDNTLKLEPLANVSLEVTGIQTKALASEFTGIITIYNQGKTINSYTVPFVLAENGYMAQGHVEIPLNLPIVIGALIDLGNSIWHGQSSEFVTTDGEPPLKISIALSGGEGVDFPIVQTTAVTNTNMTYADLGGEIINEVGSEVTRRGIVWGTSFSPTLSDNDGFTEEGEGMGIFFSRISGLERSTSYFARAYAQNSTGIGYGIVLEFETYPESGTFIDERDLNEYRFIAIGNQLWMAENLKFLPAISKEMSDISIEEPMYYVNVYYPDQSYPYDPDNWNLDIAKASPNYINYGAQYNWVAASEACPTGWHLPSSEEVGVLATLLGGFDVAGGKMKSTTNHWDGDNEGATNDSGFTGLPGGTVDKNDGSYGTGQEGFWWLGDLPYEQDDELFGKGFYLGIYTEELYIYDYYSENGFSVRCVKD